MEPITMLLGRHHYRLRSLRKLSQLIPRVWYCKMHSVYWAAILSAAFTVKLVFLHFGADVLATSHLETSVKCMVR
jgi:hypothetical protein